MSQPEREEYDLTDIEVVLKLRPPTPRVRGLARWKADAALDEKYAGQFVAYVDNWNGDELDRVVVAAAVEAADFQRLLADLDPAIRSRVEMTHLPPSDVIDVPSVWIE